MRKLKKAFSLTLALALALALAVPAFAAEPAVYEHEGVYRLTNVTYVEEDYDGLGLGRPISCNAPTELTFLRDMNIDALRVVWNDAEEGLEEFDVPEIPHGDYSAGTKFQLDKPGDYEISFMWKEGLSTAWVFILVTVEAESGSESSTVPTTPEQPTTPTTPSAPDAPGSYTVKKGDTWSTICTNFYGTNAQRYALQKANKGVALKEGAVITLPEKLGKATLISAPAAAEGEKLYTVKAGDTLGKIAAAEYGKTGEYKAIFERNADRLKNANTIYEGQVIVLPAKR